LDTLDMPGISGGFQLRMAASCHKLISSYTAFAAK